MSELYEIGAYNIIMLYKYALCMGMSELYEIGAYNIIMLYKYKK